MTYLERIGKIAAELQSELPNKVTYGELVGEQTPYCYYSDMVWEDGDDPIYNDAIEYVVNILNAVAKEGDSRDEIERLLNTQYPN